MRHGVYLRSGLGGCNIRRRASRRRNFSFDDGGSLLLIGLRSRVVTPGDGRIKRGDGPGAFIHSGFRTVDIYSC